MVLLWGSCFCRNQPFWCPTRLHVSMCLRDPSAHLVIMRGARCGRHADSPQSPGVSADGRHIALPNSAGLRPGHPPLARGETLRAVSCARAAATRTAGSLVEGLDGPVSVIPSNERILVSSMKGINCLDFVHEMGSEPSFCTIEWDSSTLIAMGMAKWNLSSIRRKIATAST